VRFTNRLFCLLLVPAIALGSLTGCGSSIDMPFSKNLQDSSYGIAAAAAAPVRMAVPFADTFCVTDGDVAGTGTVDMTNCSTAALFDLNNKTTLYAKNIFAKHYPASMTKVMTALVALQNSSTDKLLTAGDSVIIPDADAQVCGLQSGDTMTLDQALHMLLIYSANDAAVLIANSVGGSVDNFIKMMNDEAKKLGATNTNFVNSNGLSDENHYTTAYDMYLIFNEALKYDEFREIINMKTYSTTWHDQAGGDKHLSISSTDLYLTGGVTPPDGVTVIGGKTGTTDAAGHCLVLYSKDTSGNPYISIVMQAYDQDTLYRVMDDVLALIPAGSAAAGTAAGSNAESSSSANGSSSAGSAESSSSADSTAAENG
jgi:D-alanyl-D-alanine carboxypeptidase (penicillin-binding protein 5/6)